MTAKFEDAETRMKIRSVQLVLFGKAAEYKNAECLNSIS
jgi:hypothetical protein